MRNEDGDGESDGVGGSEIEMRSVMKKRWRWKAIGRLERERKMGSQIE